MKCPHCNKEIVFSTPVDKHNQEDIEIQAKLVGDLRSYILQAKKLQNNGKQVCERCGRQNPKHIHHKKYKGSIGLDDLELLCDKCHHNIPGKHYC